MEFKRINVQVYSRLEDLSVVSTCAALRVALRCVASEITRWN